MEKKAKKKSRADLILILSLLFISLVFMLVFHFCSAEGEAVKVTVDGVHVGTYLLSQDGEYSLNGGTNILVIRDGKAWISEADCPDKLCVSTGKISVSGERIVCLPNKIVVTVIGGDDYDFIPMN